MRKIFLLIMLTSTVGCKKEVEKNPSTTPFIEISEWTKKLIHKPGSKWIYENQNGMLDSARLQSVDSQVVHFMSGYNEYSDMVIFDLSYSSSLSFLQRQVYRSNLISDSYDVSCFMCLGNLQFITTSSFTKSNRDTLCPDKNCLIRGGSIDSLKVLGNIYYNVINLNTDDGKKYWWHQQTGIIKYQEGNEIWRLQSFQ